MEPLIESERKRLYSLFQNIENKDEKLNRTETSDVLIIDGLNSYLRAFSAIPTLNENGIHTGGISGFLKSIGYAIKLVKPTKCIVVFDGVGGSVRRRKIYPEYKARRKNKLRLNRIFADGSTSENEQDALKRQFQRLWDYIKVLPVSAMALDNVEADDVMAYLTVQTFKNSNVTIMSADKDFLQLVDQRVKVWSPTKKKLYGPREVLDEYGVDPRNFVLYRTLEGDDSDNIDGIKGCGPTTILKAFPFLNEPVAHTINDIFQYCSLDSSKMKICKTILENRNIVERNYDLMQLKETQLATFAQLNVEDIVKNKTKLNRFAFHKLITEDQLWNAIPSSGTWLTEVFSVLDRNII